MKLKIKKTVMMNKFVSLVSLLALGMFLFVSCQPEANKIGPCFNGKLDSGEINVDCGGDCPPCQPTCSDGIQNQGELGVDCGGPCTLCPTCNDGIQNGEETGVDCGGPVCAECPASCDDMIMNGTEEGVDCGGDCVSCDPQVVSFAATIDGMAMDNPTNNATIVVGVINISGSAAGIQISITFAADIDPGTYIIPDSGVAATLNNTSVSPSLFTANGGTIVIVSHDKVAKTITGTFNFTGDNGTDDVTVTDGSFNVTY